MYGFKQVWLFYFERKQINKTVTLFLNVFKIYGKENR